MDPLSTLLLALGTALDAGALRRVADELCEVPAPAAGELSCLVRKLAELAADAGRP